MLIEEMCTCVSTNWKVITIVSINSSNNLIRDVLLGKFYLLLLYHDVFQNKAKMKKNWDDTIFVKYGGGELEVGSGCIDRAMGAFVSHKLSWKQNKQPNKNKGKYQTLWDLKKVSLN